MNWFRIAACDVCAAIQQTPAGWSVAIQKPGGPMEWLPWDEAAARETGALHICPNENCRQEIMGKMLKQAQSEVRVN